MKEFNLDERGITTAMYERGWIKCPPILELELSRRCGGTLRLRPAASSVGGGGGLLIGPELILIEPGRVPHFIFPRNERAYYHMWFRIWDQKFIEVVGDVSDDAEAVIYKYEPGFDRAVAIVKNAKWAIGANKTYSFPKPIIT